MKHTVVRVLSHSKNLQCCVPTGESGFAVFPCENHTLHLGDTHRVIYVFFADTSREKLKEILVK